MSVRRLMLVVFVSTVTLTACDNKSFDISQYPMLPDNLGSGPWQIVTYAGDKVFHETLKFSGRNIAKESETVYISNSSQFIYRDGTPITTYDGKYLYWNKDGFVINRLRQMIPEDQVFVVNGKPMHVGTAMRLRDYHQPAPIVTLAGYDKAEMHPR